jgi:prepilin signal peptidase PulO-like enzyme (type II secretory pathway)
MSNIAIILLVLSVAMLVYASYVDIRKQEVDWWILSGAALCSLLYALTFYDYPSILASAVASISIPFVLVAISKEKWMGWGDVIFALCIGLLLSYPSSLLAVTLAFLSGALFGIIYRKINFKFKTLAFGPFLTFGCLVMLIFGKQILNLLEKLI